MGNATLAGTSAATTVNINRGKLTLGGAGRLSANNSGTATADVTVADQPSWRWPATRRCTRWC